MKIIILKFFYIVLIFIFILPFIYPLSADAQVKTIAQITSCSAGGIISQGLSDYINDGLPNLTKKFPAPVRKLLGFLDGEVSGAVPVNDANFQMKWSNKESRMDIIARCSAREIYDRMIGNTLNVVRNHGRDGGPTFVKNWRNFITGSQYRGENLFRAILSNTQLCEHFGRELKTAFNAAASQSLPSQNTRLNDFDSFALKAGCTLPSNWSLEEYANDFSANGGWTAFAKLLEPQNNSFGSLLLAMDEAAKQRGFEEQLDLAEAGGSGGFTSRRGRGDTDSCLVRSSNNQCVVYKDILTPGSVLQDSVGATIQQELAWITNVDELGEVVTQLVNNLLNRMLNLTDNDDSRQIDPADLPIYNSAPINDNPPQLEGEEGPIEPPPGDNTTQENNNELSCSPTSQRIKVGDTAVLSATGGDGSYSWHTDDGTPSDGTESGFSTTFSKVDNETVRLTSGGVTVECYVFIE